MFNFNPFTQVYQRLLTTLSNDSLLSTLVEPGNIVDFTGANPEPVKDEVEDADLPEMQLIPLGGPVKRDNTMKLTVDYAFSVQITTGDNRINAWLLPIQWAIIRGVYAAGDSLGLSWVKMVRLTALTNQSNDPAQRGIEGWVTVMHIVVTMLLDNDCLEAGNEPVIRTNN